MTHCPHCGGKGWNYPGPWAIGLMRPYNAIIEIPCGVCNGTGIGPLETEEILEKVALES